MGASLVILAASIATLVAGSAYRADAGPTPIVLAWGANSSLLDVPAPVALPADVIAVATGSEGSVDLALTSDGQVYAWGDNTYGQVGLPPAGSPGGTDYVPDPTLVPGLVGVTVSAIAEGNTFDLALTPGGQVYAWGENTFGTLGNHAGDTGGSCSSSLPPLNGNFPYVCDYTPVQVDLSSVTGQVAGIAAMGHDGILWTTGNQVYAWGMTFDGELGDGNQVGNNPGGCDCQDYPGVQVDLPAGATVTTVSGGADYALALTSDGLYAWGYNADGELGIGNLDNGTNNDESACFHCYSIPQAVLIPGTVTEVSAGSNQALAVTSAGLYSWGDNSFGEQDIGSENGSACPGYGTCADTPALVVGLGTVNDIAAGYFFDLVSTSAGALYGWGYTGFGVLGNGSTSGNGANCYLPNQCQDVALQVPLPNGDTVTACSTCLAAGFGILAITQSAIPALLITTTASQVPSATQGVPYSFQLQATGGVAPYTWSIGSGALAAGLTLSPSGLISGTPDYSSVFVPNSFPGTYDFSPMAKDSSVSPQTTSQPLAVTLVQAGGGGGPPPPPPPPPPIVCNGHCSVLADTSTGTVEVDGTSVGSGIVDLSVATGTLDCSGLDYSSQVTDVVSTTTFPAGLRVITTIDHGSDPKAYVTCYSDPTAFVDAAGNTVNTGFLPACPATPTGPCVVSQLRRKGNVVVTIHILDGDPRFWTGKAGKTGKK